jgi:hypothetical protein
MRAAIEFVETACESQPQFQVIHPLDDEPEQKVDTTRLGPMKMTKTVRVCLYALRGYFVVMLGMLGYRVLELAGVIGR